MFPIKVVAEISKILLNYTDSFIIDKNYDIRLNTNSESLGIYMKGKKGQALLELKRLLDKRRDCKGSQRH